MQLRTAPILVCFALAAADCSWDAAPTSDFITSGSGESNARTEILQARKIWPRASLDNDIEFDAARLLAPPAPATSTSAPGDQGGMSGTGASIGTQ